MRRWHKFLAPWFALILFVLALTGVATQTTSLLDTRPVASAPAPAVRDGKPPQKQPSAMRSWNRWVKHLHSGESLGPVGIALNLAGGLALLFFAGSGFWMYLSMALRLRRGRRTRLR
jgi:uncharacterized iron-regulated membrane protein